MAKKEIDTSHLNAQQFRELVQVQKDVFYFSTFAYVVHPVRGKTRFLLYPYQKSVLYCFLKHRFNIILKFRQAGITELISLYCLWLTMYHPNKKVNISSSCNFHWWECYPKFNALWNFWLLSFKMG